MALRSAMRETVAYLNWVFNPLARFEAAPVYDLLSTRSPTSDALYLNLGYWRDATTLDEACRALPALLADTAGLGAGDDVVDVGFGFADQDLYWLQHWQPRRIIGLNITASQVRVARQRVAAQDPDGRIQLLQGSATAMPLAENSCDVVFAQECAFHFNSREDFFREAWRVLRPGGRLVTADVLPSSAEPGGWERFVWRSVARRFAMLEINAYPREVYAANLRAAGFAAVAVRSIRDQVYAPLHAYIRRDAAARRRLHAVARLGFGIALALPAETVFGAFDYVLASAQKPSRNDVG